MADPIALTESNFDEFIDRGGIIVISFWAPGYEPANTFQKSFAAAARKNDDICFATVDVEDQDAIAEEFGIEFVPTLFVMRDGEPVIHDEEPFTEKELAELIADVREVDMDFVRAENEKFASSADAKDEPEAPAKKKKKTTVKEKKTMAEKTIALTETNFDEIFDRDGIIVVSFWAEGYEPAMDFLKIYGEAAKKHEDVVFATLDVESEEQIAEEFGIEFVPTVFVMRDGEPVVHDEEPFTAEEFEELIADVRAVDMDEVRDQNEAFAKEVTAKKAKKAAKKKAAAKAKKPAVKAKAVKKPAAKVAKKPAAKAAKKPAAKATKAKKPAVKAKKRR